jgi:ribosome-associated heat shock protein Hsp15
MAESTSDRVRIDKWLWAARLAKTRPMAAEAVRGGHVELNGRRVPPGKRVAVGDRIELTIDGIPRSVVVHGLAERRGPASVAATLYEETPESKKKREALVTQIRSMPSDDWETGRPTKRDRRDIERFKRR